MRERRLELWLPHHRILFVGIILSVALIHWVGLVFEVHLPATDVFLFKDPGVNLAVRGKLMAVNLPHMPVNEEYIYSYYPPVFPVVYGIWSSIVGIGLWESQLFDSILMGIRSLLILAFLSRWLNKPNLPTWIVTVSAFGLSLVTAERDRPDELAIIFGLAAWLQAHASFNKLWDAVKAGVWLGLCGATSPAGGVFFAAGIAILWRTEAKKWVVCSGAISALIYAGVNLPVYLADPAAFGRFTKQLPLSVAPYLEPLKRGDIGGVFGRFGECMLHWWQVASPLISATVGLLILVSVMWRRAGKWTPDWIKHLVWISVGSVPAILLVWTLQPFYLWFTCVALLIAVFGFVVGEPSRTARMAIAGSLALAFTPMVAREAKLYLSAFQRSPIERSVRIRNSIVPNIRRSARIATTPDQYFTFKPFRDVANVNYVCDSIDKFDFVYITRDRSAHKSVTYPIPIPCRSVKGCFKAAGDFSLNTPFRLFGQDTDYFVRGSGGTLYAQESCDEDVPSRYTPQLLSSLQPLLD